VKPLPLGRGESVLLVAEHDARLLRDEEVLAALGYEPLGFASADAALAACRANPDRIDAIIVGHAGSTISSLQLAAALHAVAPDLPIVLATRSPGEIGTDSLLGVGIADVVHWPIVAAEIANALHHGLLQIRHDAPGTAAVARNARSLVH
jgi:DNA-binding NtrC family response regulator